MLHKRVFVMVLALLVFTIGFAAITFAQSETPTATPTTTPIPVPGFTVEPESTLDPSGVFVTPFEDNVVVNIRRGPGVRFTVRGLLRNNRFLEAIGYNGFDLDRPCTENLQNDIDMWI